MNATIRRRPRKHGDRMSLLDDVNYFANELIRVVEALVKVDAGRVVEPSWKQSAALTRRVRGLARHEADEQRRRAKSQGKAA